MFRQSALSYRGRGAAFSLYQAAMTGALASTKGPARFFSATTHTATTFTALTEGKRGYLRRTAPCCGMKIELDPSSQNYYSMDHAFEEPTFRFICEGVDVDFKVEVREALKKLLPSVHKKNFTQHSDDVQQQANTSQVTMQLFRALCQRGLVSFAQVRSTPRLLASFYETVATAHPALALVMADHLTFAGLIATHAAETYRTQVLNDVDSGRILGAIAHTELVAEGTPLYTEARYDKAENCFVLRGAGKFSIVGGEHADWIIVSATLTMNKDENNGTHAFVMPLREKGILRDGVTIKPIQGESPLFSSTGAAVLHFDNVRLPADALMAPYCVDAATNKVAYLPGREGEEDTMLVLRDRTRLASGALYLGTLKTLLTDVVRFTAQKTMVGPDHRRNYPYLGFQNVQTPLVSLVAQSYVYMAAWQHLIPIFTDVSGKTPSYEDRMRLFGTVYFLQDSIMKLHRFSDEFLGVHGSFNTTRSNAAAALVHLRQESADQSALIREVAYLSVIKNVGTTHWGWWLTNLLQPFPAIDRFIKNPMYSPRIADLGRHLLFFSHKHYGIKKRLRQSRELERRKGGSEHQWYDWTMFRHRDVVHCGEAFMEMFYMERMMAETESCADPRGRKILRDMGWIYALSRQMERLDYILANQLLSRGKALILASHLDNIVTVLAPQCVNLVDAMQVPMAFRAPCGAEDIEPYWTIPGTNTHIERGDTVTVHTPDARTQGNTKAEQEAMKEEAEPFDLFHGLADKPSYSTKK